MKLNTRSRSLLVGLAVAVLVAALAAAGPASAGAKTLNGSVGPGFTISLKQGGSKVSKLKAGTYRITISDKSSSHNFRLKGPGYNRAITSVGFKGTKTVTVKLRNGTYRYQCDPHSSLMNGSFRVG
jgi:plastocyanin